ncbi:MAG TPA: hypothetical protein DIC42_01420 [Holosporales bacterium]|nr:hypothetical protein [Holosporales bacterium]
MDLVVLIALTCFVFYRLWSILGTKTGIERKRTLILDDADNVIVMTKKQQIQENPDALHEEEFELTEHQNRLVTEIVKNDPDFDPVYFLKGAEAAYSMITKAFANGNKKRLKVLLSDKMYQLFSYAIIAREKDNLRIETKIESFEIVEIDAAKVIENNGEKIASITVFFKTKQIVVTYNQNDEIVENEAKTSVLRQDYWTFERAFNAASLQWTLVNTKTR